jgi:hypothetical protein
MTGLALPLVLLAAFLLVAAAALLLLSPAVAGRVASSTSRPKLERRASGPDRMRNLIAAQRTERARRSILSRTFTRAGVALGIASAITLIAGGIAWLAGY